MNNYMKTIISGLKQWVSSQKSDWNQNDSSAANFIKNRPFYSEEKEKVLFSGNILVENAWDNVYSAEGLAYGLSFVAGQIYKITFDNVEYLCECKLLGSARVFGNTMIVGEGEETEEPFFIGYNDDWGLCLYCLTEGTHSLSISGTVEKVHQIDKKYVPMPDLAKVALSGDYFDLYNKPEIPTGVVHYNERQELSESEARTARGNIEALAFSDPPSFYNYNVYHINASKALLVGLEKTASSYFEVSSDGTAWDTKSLNTSYLWKNAAKGFSSDEIILFDGEYHFAQYFMNSNFASSFVDLTLKNNAPYTGMQIIGTKLVMLCSSGDKVMVSMNGRTNFSEVSLPISAEWLSFLKIGSSDLLLIPKTGDKGLFSKDGITWTEFLLPESNDWLAPNVVVYQYGSGSYYYLFLISSNETKKIYMYAFNSSTWETLNLSKTIKPGILVGTSVYNSYLLPRDGSESCYKFTLRNNYGQKEWIIEGQCQGLASNPTYVKIDNSNYFLVNSRLSSINYYNQRLVLDQNFILNNDSIQATKINSKLAEIVIPYLQAEGFANELATTTTRGLMSSSDKTKLDNEVVLKSERVVLPGTGTNSIVQKGGSNIANGNYSQATGLGTLAYGSYASSEGGGSISTLLLTGEANATVYNTTKVSSFAVKNLVIYNDIIAEVTAVDTTAGTVTLNKTLSSEAFSDYVRVQSKGYAYGLGSHSEGMNTIARGDGSHAEGENTVAYGAHSHAEGSLTTASGNKSHAEGYNTTASSLASHAEGYNTKASGERSHAEGDSTIASGYASHAEGNGTIASSMSQHVQGRFNIENSNNKYAHIVGNGISDTSRSNAHTLDWNGNAWFAGDIYVGGTSQDNATKLGDDRFIVNVTRDAEFKPSFDKTYEEIREACLAGKEIVARDGSFVYTFTGYDDVESYCTFYLPGNQFGNTIGFSVMKIKRGGLWEECGGTVNCTISWSDTNKPNPV